MDEMEKQNATPKEQQPESQKDFVFIREEIKNRPVNKGKLAKSTLISAVSAVVFGLVACLTFAVLLPFITGIFDKEEEAPEMQYVIFPEETIEEEMNPEDMLQEPEPEVVEVETPVDEEEIRDIVNSIDFEYEFTVEDYTKLYAEVAEIAANASKSMVKVRTVITELDWFANLVEETEEIPGFIITDNGTDIFILTYGDNLSAEDNIYVTFSNDTSVQAFIKNTDPRTGLCILYVPESSINKTTQETITVATLGSSGSVKLSGALVLAIGSPMGSYGSYNYGMISAYGIRMNVMDNSLKKITTNIYGSNIGRGVLVNTSGEIIGILNSKYADKGSENLVTAIGITELKKTIENMINDVDLIYFGITGLDVPEEARDQYAAPKGAFITSVAMDSPAMVGGIQTGDIITEINGKTVITYSELVSGIRGLTPDQEVVVVANRLTTDGYKELRLTVVPRKLN